MKMNEKLLQLRITLQLSTNAFAKTLGCSTTQLKRYEQGITPIPTTLIQTIQAKYKVNTQYFYANMPLSQAIPQQKTKEQINAEIANRIKQRRIQLQLTQKQLSQLSNVTESQISQIEALHYTLSDTNAEKIANALQTSTIWIKEGLEEYKEYPVNQKVIDYLWKHPKLRKELWMKVNGK